MADLNMMFQNGMGNFAALNAGRQMGLDQQMTQADLQAKQLANAQTAAMNPLNQQFMQGRLAEQQAQLPGVVGQSQSLASQGQVDQTTTNAKIAQRLSSLGNQIGVDGMQKMGRDGELALQASQMLKQYPPALHKQVLPQIMQAYGADPNSPMVQGILKAPDDRVQSLLETTGTSMAMASRDYLTRAALLNQENASKEKVASGNNDTSVKVANIMADSRVKAAQFRMSTMMQHMNTDQKISYLSDVVAKGEASPEEMQELQDLKKHVYNRSAVAATAVAPSLLGVPTPMQNAADAAGGAPQTPATPVGTAQADIQTALQKAGQAYEPDKYMYRMGPNGQVQRAPIR